MQISVIVCTRNNVEQLKRCIASFSAIKTSLKWELIIVDNGSTDSTGSFLSPLPDRINNAKIEITFEPEPILSRARNKGIAQANGDIIAFTDSDCYVTENYIDMMVAAFTSHPDAGFIGGRILLHDPSDLRLTIDERDAVSIIPPYSFLKAGEINGKNMAFRRDVLNVIGHFDESFGVGTPFPCDDVDAQARALWSGFSGVFDPRPTVFHHHGRKTRKHANEIWKAYDVGRGAYYAKYILRRDTRAAYLNGWTTIFRANFRNAKSSPQSYLSLTRRTLRELTAGMRYIVQKPRSY